MSGEEKIRKLPVIEILDNSRKILQIYPVSCSLFALGHLVFLSLFELMNRWESPLFIVWLAAYYMFGIYFYRFYFRRKPYFTLSITFKSLLPSTKIIFLVIVIFSILLFLPYIPLFLTNNTVLLEKYLDFLDMGMQKSKLIDFASNLAFVFISPIVLYRPFMAWIASLVGRRGSIIVAFGKTRNNYWKFFLLGLIMNTPIILIGQIEFYFDINNFLYCLIIALLTVYYSIIFAKCYEFFYMGNSEDE